ncbi:4363_t:CDS:2 [Funneliformis mosseae]|uniref:4363_t:CDS:1 n=1 Tax=Funneliformis mosseae TaxID=27381 RepID=A0A9N9E5E9_FUNMO|nr:4363_t:CDS:2 [Funneliformis mosseae]
MRTPTRKATIIFVGILLLFLLSFVSAEIDKRADDGNAKQPAADEPKDPATGGKQPAKDPADGAKDPAAGGKQPAAGGKQPAAGGKQPAAGGKQPAANGTDETPPYVDPLMPTVQVQITEPKSAKNILYKIGSNITFEWKYSANFSVKPKYLIVKAQPSVNLKTFYTIAQNLTVNETQQVIWDTSAESSSLPMSQYKLLISDEEGMDAAPKPGGLQPFANLIFGLYQSQEDDPFSCPSCNNNAANSFQIIPLLNTIGLTLITIMSFNFEVDNEQ